MKKIILSFCALLISTVTYASINNDLIIQLKEDSSSNIMAVKNLFPTGSQLKNLNFNNWVHITIPNDETRFLNINSLRNHPQIANIQPNYEIRLINTEKPGRPDWCPEPIPEEFCDIGGGGGGGGGGGTAGDNPDFPAVVTNPNTGSDPMFDKQWGMKDIEATDAWNKSNDESNLIVAVIDTGVDYTHEDLVGNLWRNQGESGTDANGADKATNGVDDDNNGYVDDLLGWDFAKKDNKPYDLKGGGVFGGNPGHGTHCAGNVGARGGNGIGITGVAQKVKIMSLRFLSESGSGTTADAILAIKYAADNGAKVLSNSWASIGENKNDPEGNKALRDVITYSQEKGALFVAAAGNGDRSGRGYNNDTSNTPAYPASYDMENIVSVAALDSSDSLGSFSNWGQKTVDIGAPGVNVYSAFPGNKYGSISGTSMATPHVAGAAALYWSANPNKTWKEVKEALMSSAKPISALTNKVSSNGKLFVKDLMTK